MGMAGKRYFQRLMSHSDCLVKVRYHEFAVNPGSKVVCLWRKSGEEFYGYWAYIFPVVI